MSTQKDLRLQLLQLEGQSYKAYRSIQGSYQFEQFTLWIDWVQGDPFAAPSPCRVQVPQAIAAFPSALYGTRSREVALRDYLTRQFEWATRQIRQNRGTGNSGLIAMVQPGQAILERSAVLINPETVEARFVVGLPAVGRRIAGRQAATMLCEDLSRLVDRALQYANLDAAAIEQQVALAEDGDWLRQQLADRGLVAFVGNGAILPRRSGVADQPLQQGSIPFQSPSALQVTFDCPNRGKITGMGIPSGVTLIVGGGYHGKSTLLRAIERGVYNHIPGDGREWVVTQSSAVKIRAEDGRSVRDVDISPFINHLPQGRSTQQFSTPNASGSTSQAANIMEALEAGARVLLVDEDTTATNFMIRDRRMQALIAKEKEPITPFVDKVGQLYRDYGVSTILVMGGSGDYFDVADTVIAMEDFQPQEVTARAQAIAREYGRDRTPEGGSQFGPITHRTLPANLLQVLEGDRPRWKVYDTHKLVLEREEIDLAAVEQMIEPGQLRAIAAALVYLQTHYLDGQRALPELLDAVCQDLDQQGLDCLSRRPPGDWTLFRRFELAAVLNRLR